MLKEVLALVPGTIPDGVSTSGQNADELDGIPSSVIEAVEPQIGTWDQYFDEKRDLRLEGRGGTFRCAATLAEHWTLDRTTRACMHV